MIRFAALLLVVIQLVAAPLAAQEATAPSGPITAESDARMDATIATRIREILGELGGYEDVTVTVNDGIVTLRGETATATEVDALDAIVNRIEGVVQVRNLVTQTTDITRQLDPAWDRFVNRINQVVAFLPLFAVAGIVFVAILFFGFLIARLRRPFERIAPNAFIADLLRQVVRLVFIIVAIVAALDILNATALLSTILGAAGLIGLAIGFAVRDTVENFIASVMLSIRQPFRPNDAVEINGDEGKVIRLTSRATILLSWDGNQIRIPNATVFKSRIVNFSQNPERRFLFEIGIASNADLAAMRHLAEDVVAGLPFTLSTPAPSVWIDRIGDGAVILVVTGWVDQRNTSLLAAKGEALRIVKAAIEAAGVEVPDTTYRIDLIGAPPGPHAPDRKAPGTRPAAPPMAGVEDVSPRVDTALEEIIEGERQDNKRPDLLRENAPRE